MQSQEEASLPLTLGAQEAHFPPAQQQQEDKVTTTALLTGKYLPHSTSKEAMCPVLCPILTV